MDDTRYTSPTFRARRDKNIFEIVWTYFRVQMDLFWVQNCHFGTQMTKEVKNLWETYWEMDDTRSSGPSFWACQDENIFEMFWTYFRVQMDLFRVQNWHFWTYMPLEVEKVYFSQPFQMEMFLEWFGSISWSNLTYFRVKMDQFRVRNWHFWTYMLYEAETMQDS